MTRRNRRQIQHDRDIRAFGEGARKLAEMNETTTSQTFINKRPREKRSMVHAETNFSHNHKFN